MEDYTLIIVTLAIVTICIGLHSLSSMKRLPLPPGPPRAPIIGNLRNFPKDNWVQAFSDWKGQYGDVVYTSILGKSTVVLNSRKVLEELLMERAPKYQGRPRHIMGVELSGWEWNCGFKQAGPELVQERKVLLSGLGPSTVKMWYPKIEKATTDFLCQIAENAEMDVSGMLKDYLANIVIPISYGEGIYQAHKKELIETNVKGLDMLNDIHTKFWFVDILPFLQYIPRWFPGATFLRIAEESRSFTHKMRDWPFQLVLEETEKGIAHASLARQSLEDGHEPERVRDGVAVLFAAGLDTLYAVLTTFLLAMLLHPEHQLRAQREVDSFIQAEDRLPGFQDRSHFPFLEAIYKEILRWNPPVPLSVEHATVEEDEYRGMRIPKNSAIVPNVWLAMHEEETFPNPDEFQPDRYFNDHKNLLPDPVQFIFGFGRRICPGKHLADRIIYYTMVQILALFDIKVSADVKGPVKAEFDREFFSYARVPKSKFVLRNKALLPIH